MTRCRTIGAALIIFAASMHQRQALAQSFEVTPTSYTVASDMPVPANRMQTMLLRNALAAVNQGILTGNFTVLRDLSTDCFRRSNQAGDLAAKFAPLRQQKIDLSPTLIIDPQLERAAIDPNTGLLQLVGFFPTKPRRIDFAFEFERVNGGWMINQIAINAAPPTN
jgi:hypothetical protein